MIGARVNFLLFRTNQSLKVILMIILDYLKGNLFICLYNNSVVYDQYQLQFIGFKMSHKTNSSLDDTIPLDKNAPGFGLSDSNQTYYGSELSMSTSNQSKDSSVKIVYEVINLEGSKSDERKDQVINLRFGR